MVLQYCVIKDLLKHRHIHGRIPQLLRCREKYQYLLLYRHTFHHSPFPLDLHRRLFYRVLLETHQLLPILQQKELFPLKQIFLLLLSMHDETHYKKEVLYPQKFQLLVSYYFTHSIFNYHFITFFYFALIINIITIFPHFCNYCFSRIYR